MRLTVPQSGHFVFLPTCFTLKPSRVPQCEHAKDVYSGLGSEFESASGIIPGNIANKVC